MSSSRVRVRMHMKEGDGEGLSKPRAAFIEDYDMAGEQNRERQSSSVKDWALREDDPEELSLIRQYQIRNRNRAAQLAFRERTGKRLKQLEADSENLEKQASASHAETEVLRKQIEDPNILLKDFRKDGMEASQETQVPDSKTVGYPTHTKGYQQSEAFVDDPARSSTPDLRSAPSLVSHSRRRRCSHQNFGSCFRCRTSREPPKSRSLNTPAAKTDSSLQALAEFLTSGLSALPGVEQPEWHIHANALTPPETPTLENENTALDSLAVGSAVIPKPVNSKEVADEELQDQHKGRNPDVVRKDEQVTPAASNEGEDHQLRKVHVPAIPSRSSTDSNRVAKSGVPPDARWTKISKNLVDARVLDDSNERYKEVTNEVVVFRVLTKEEIYHYAIKTQESRKKKAGVLEKEPSSRSSERDLKDLVPRRKEVSVTLANDVVELVGQSESSKQDDRRQMEEKISTGNAARPTENGDDAIHSITESLKVNQEQVHALKTRNAKTDQDSREDSNRRILIFTFFAVNFLILGLLLDFFPPMFSIYDKREIRLLLRPAFTWSYKSLPDVTLDYSTVSSNYHAIGACMIRILGSISYLYRNNLSRRSHQKWYQRWHRVSQSNSWHRRGLPCTMTLISIILYIGSGTELVMLIVAKPGVSFESSALYEFWHTFCCLAGCLLLYMVIPETSSHTLKELEHISSTPLRKDGFFNIAKMKWLLRDLRQESQSFFLSVKKQLSFSRNVQTTILSPTEEKEGESPRKQRIHGQCRCGYRFCDDFAELRPLAIAEYGESLLRRVSTSRGRASPVDQAVRSKSGGDMGTTRPQSSNWSSFVSSPGTGIMTIVKAFMDKKSSAPPLPQYEVENGGAAKPGSSSCNNELLYLLMCIPQHQYATKLLQPQISAIRSDQDFFLLVRDNYRQMRGRIRRLLSLKALRSVKFVQLEMYKSELVDIRKQDDLPPEDKKEEYRYNPVPAEIIPPVGENHMLHLINHPTHAEEDGFVLDRIPKKLRERLLVCPSRGTGLGWGIYFIEGWHVSIITIVTFAVLLAGSLAFLICWSVLKHDVQGASGVAAYIVAFLGLAIGSIQAVFELT